MDCYRLILLSDQEVNLDQQAQVWRNAGCSCEKILGQIKCCNSCSVKLACVDLTSKEEETKWKSVNGQESQKFLQNAVEEIRRRPKSLEKNTIDGPAQAIHHLADQVPYNGIVTVVWHFASSTSLAVRSQMELFGALYRLVEWHHAKVYLIVEDLDEDDIVGDWMEMLEATIVTPKTVLAPSLWSGNIVISGTKSHLNLGGIEMSQFQEEEPILLHNTSHEKENPQSRSSGIISSTMEILAAVPLFQVPAFFMSEKRVVFRVRSDSSRFQTSREFFEVLREDPEVCYIARLNYGESIKRPPKKDTTWQDAVIQQPSRLSDLVEPVELENVIGWHNFLLYGIPENGGGCMAVLLHPPSSLNGSLMQKLALKDMEHPPSSEFFEQVKDWVKNAHCASADGIVKMEQIIDQAQVAVLRAWIEEQTNSGKDASLTTDELLSLLELTRVEFTKKSALWHSQDAVSEFEAVNPLLKPASELQDHTSSQMELLALQLKEKSQIERGIIAPPSKSQQVTLDAAEFLKLFHKDGTSANGDLEPVLRTASPSKRLLRFNSNEKFGRTESWPACFCNDSHGKHYHNGDEAEKLEKVCNKLKARLQPIETAGFFSSPSASIAASKVKAKVKRSTNRTPCKEKVKRVKSTPKSPGVKRNKSVLEPRKKSSPRVPTPQHTSGNESRTPEVSSASRQSESSVSRSAKSGSRANDTAQKSQARGNEQEKRSQRHKRKLEETVRRVLEKHDVMTDDPIFKSASQKLFELVKCYLKGLKTSHNLRQEMENLAELHAAQVIAFEKKYS